MKIKPFQKKWTLFVFCLICSLLFSFILTQTVWAQGDDDRPPDEPVKLVFIHHSTGENWLRDGYGNLGRTLAQNNYFVSDTNYGWGANSIGDRTDIVDWPQWFGNERDEAILQELYEQSEQNADYTRLFEDPGGENSIILFKSCFPNSDLEGNPQDESQPGEYSYSVGSAKAIYNQLLPYFNSRPDKLFIAITAPPLSDPTHAANARAFNLWLVNDWLADYPGNNVAVFDFYTVLTGKEHHHRFVDGRIEHTYASGHDTLVYPSDDDHPSSAGSQKATDEFVPLLNVYYRRWAAGAPATLAQDGSSQEVEEDSVETDEMEMPEEDEAQQIQPNLPESGSLIDDFDGVTGVWHCTTGNEAVSKVEGKTQSARTHGGSMAMRLLFEFQEDDYVDCGREFEPPQNWSAADGLSFWVQSDQKLPDVTLTLVTGGIPYDVRTSIPQTEENQWKQLRVTWSDFELAAWADAEENTQFDLTEVMALVFTVDSYDGVRQGQFWLDDIELLDSSTAGIVSNPSRVEEAPASTQEAAGDELEVEAESVRVEEPTGEGALRSICPFSAFALPFGTVAISFWLGIRRKKN